MVCPGREAAGFEVKPRENELEFSQGEQAAGSVLWGCHMAWMRMGTLYWAA